MTYATQQDLIDRFGERELIQLTDRADPPAGTVNATVVTRALTDADELINSYVGKRYAIPLSVVPGRLVRVAGDLARYFLHEEGPTDSIKEDYKTAIQFLKDVAGGVAVLDAEGLKPGPASDGLVVTSQERRFSRDRMKGY